MTMRDTPGRPGARDLSDDAIRQILDAEAEAPAHAVRGDGMPEGPIVERERTQAEAVCAELERIGNALLELHLALHEVQERIRRDAL